MPQKATFSVRGGLQEFPSDADSNALEFSVLTNCLVDKQLGAVVKRRGSTTQTITGTLGVPLGMGEYQGSASTSLIPITRELLVHFATGTFREFSSGSWSSTTASTHTSFNGSKQMSSAMFRKLWIASGRPALWGGSGTDVERVGIPKPTTAITAALGVGGGLTGTYNYVWTYYRASDGLESDPAPISNSVTAAAQTIDLTIPTTAPSAEGTITKRIYRTFAGGSTHRLVTTLPLATAAFNDNVADAALGLLAPEPGDHGLPPDESFINEVFGNHVWWVDSANPYRLVFSKPFIGSDADLHYYPDANQLITDKPITGLLSTPRRLLVFHPRSISAITGFSETDFTFQPLQNGVGTLFHHSIATNGDRVVFLAEQGFVALSGDGFQHISRPIDINLQSLLNREYNDTLYVSSVWNPSMRQFLFMVSANATDGAPWVNSESQQLAEWVDSSTGAIAQWEDTASPGTEETRRIKMWGWSDELNLWSEYRMGQFEDLNEDETYPTFLFHPLPSSDTLDPQQAATSILYFDGTGTPTGKVIFAMQRGVSMDDSDNVTSTAMTGRCIPGQDGNFKRMFWLEFEGEYADPTFDGDGTVQFLKEFYEPQFRDFSGELLEFRGTTDRKVFDSGIMRFFHLYVRDTGSTLDKVLLQKFKIHYRDRPYRESR